MLDLTNKSPWSKNIIPQKLDMDSEKDDNFQGQNLILIHFQRFKAPVVPLAFGVEGAKQIHALLLVTRYGKCLCFSSIGAPDQNAAWNGNAVGTPGIFIKSSCDWVAQCPVRERGIKKESLLTTLLFGTTLAGMAPPECISKPARILHPNAGHPKGPSRFAYNFFWFCCNKSTCLLQKDTYIYTWLQWLQFKLEGATLGPQNLEPGFFSCKHPAVGGVDIISIIMIIDTPPGQKMAQPQGEMFFKLKGFACSIWGLAVWPWHYHHHGILLYGSREFPPWHTSDRCEKVVDLPAKHVLFTGVPGVSLPLLTSFPSLHFRWARSGGKKTSSHDSSSVENDPIVKKTTVLQALEEWLVKDGLSLIRDTRIMLCIRCKTWSSLPHSTCIL